MSPDFKGSGLALIGFRPARPNTIGNISDGSSSTIMLCESAGRPEYYIGRTLQARELTDGGWGNHENNYGVDGAILGTDTSPGNCMINCHNDGETYAFHSGGANHAFADGSTHFLSETISATVYAAFVTARGESLTAAEVSPW